MAAALGLVLILVAVGAALLRSFAGCFAVTLCVFVWLFGEVGFIFGTAVFMAGFLAWRQLFLSPCPGCGSRGTLTYLHARIDGGPDRRYKSNPFVCVRCRWMG